MELIYPSLQILYTLPLLDDCYPTKNTNFDNAIPLVLYSLHRHPPIVMNINQHII